ncbi:uncharacterized protein LOC142324256 isoform X2 [Lycorma delicatula]|uniref:uncharacterized protein LOC142324256 isoform X2 n=1 Tax=Lycorma delicatula TaxID=130591 RepID=UPI003F51A183
MPQCKDRLRYRWLGFHLDLTTSARLRSAATPARRPRSKKRRPRKQDDPRFETFNLLFALGLVPTKSRMNDPQGLLLNRMHVMDGDCPKSEVIGEKAPELDISSRTTPTTTIVGTTAADTTAALTVATKDVVINNASSTLFMHQQNSQDSTDIIGDKKDIDNSITNVSQDSETRKKIEEEKENNGIVEEDEIMKKVDNSGNNCNVITNNNKVKNSEIDNKMGGNSCSLVNGNNSSESSELCDSDTKCVDDDDDDMVVEEEEDDVELEKTVEEDMLEETEQQEVVKNVENAVVNNINNNTDESEQCEKSKPIDENVSLIKKEVITTDVNEMPSVTITATTASSGISSNVKTKEENNGGCSGEEDDRNSVTSSQTGNSNQNRKRTLAERGEGETEIDNDVEGEGDGEGSSSESEGGTKRQRVEVEAEDERERLVREYVERCTQSVEEMSRNADKLQREIGALGELARAKELEWNSILRLRKLKEEMLERLLRRRRQAMMLADNGLTQEWATDYSKPKLNKNPNNQLMMVPVVSSSPGNLTSSVPITGINSRPLLSSPDTTRMSARMQRPILPKPSISHSHTNNSNNNNNNSILDQQLKQTVMGEVIGEGRQGPILDVKSIIADYRSRHPENVPRRGRRMKSPMVSSTRITGSSALMSMANMALCSGAHIRTSQDCSSERFNSLNTRSTSVATHCTWFPDNSRPSSTDSTRSTHQPELPAPGLSFKDVLVQFAKMSQPPPPSPAPIKQPPPPPPPYPEVTLHPVPAPQSPPPTHSSLLHGILTKTTAAPSSTSTVNHRPTTFSPTLARLLTAPERERTTPMMSSQFRPPPINRVSITDLLTSSKKTRNEITITPVSSQSPLKSKDEVVLLDDDEETDSTDRLVIDESADRDREGNGNGEVTSDDVPECQGCHQRAAQFVCAGCGNQWYCSRECQVTAWEEHSEMCSG